MSFGQDVSQERVELHSGHEVHQGGAFQRTVTRNVLNEQENESKAGEEFTYHCPIRMNFKSNKPGNGLACIIQVSIADCIPLSYKAEISKRYEQYILMLLFAG